MKGVKLTWRQLACMQAARSYCFLRRGTNGKWARHGAVTIGEPTDPAAVGYLVFYDRTVHSLMRLGLLRAHAWAACSRVRRQVVEVACV